VGDDPASQIYVRNKEKACENWVFTLFNTIYLLVPLRRSNKMVNNLNQDELFMEYWVNFLFLLTSKKRKFNTIFLQKKMWMVFTLTIWGD
jgi:hypothetical protein